MSYTDGSLIPQYVDNAGGGGGVEPTTNAGDPTGVVTPDAVGQVCIDTVNNIIYVASGIANTDWVQTSPVMVYSAGDPNGVVTPDATGQTCIDTDNNIAYINVDGTNTGWQAAPNPHAASHQNGGGDEISVAGLSGELADDQPPKAHAASHQNSTDAINNVVASGSDTTDRTTTTGNIVEITGCEMTFTAIAKTYRLHYTGMHNIAGVGPATMRIYYQIDAGGWVQFVNHATVVATAAVTVCVNIPLTLAAGSRTIKIGFDPDAGTMHTEGDVIATHAAITQ